MGVDFLLLKAEDLPVTEVPGNNVRNAALISLPSPLLVFQRSALKLHQVERRSVSNAREEVQTLDKQALAAFSPQPCAASPLQFT